MTETQRTLVAPRGAGPEAVREALGTSFGLRAEPPSTRAHAYLDTFDGRIHGAGWTLEHDGRAFVLHGRDDAELASAPAPAPTARARLFAGDLPMGPLRDAVRRVVEMRVLLPLARVQSRERLLRVLDGEEKTVCRIVVQEPRVGGPRGIVLSTRLRVESVRGYDKAARKVERLLVGALALDAGSTMLVDEAVRSAGGVPGGVSSKVDVMLAPGDRGDQAAARVATRLLEVIAANLPGALEDLDTEFLHDLRVAVRRTRALQREMRGVFPVQELDRWRAEFKWLQAVTGPSRDLDVYVLEFEGFLEILPEARRADIEPLRALLIRRRAAAHRRMRRDLRSDRTTTILAGWAELLRAMQEGRAGGPAAATPVVELASARIASVHRRMVSDGRKIDDETPAEALHELRKKGKELRYLLEFFAPLYPREVTKPMISSLKALQDTLGRHQDREIQADLVASLADDIKAGEDGAAALMAMGILVQWLHDQQADARSEFAARFSAFADKKQRALVKQVFA